MRERKGNLQPVIRVAPPGDLRLYVVHEHQLDQLAQGSPVSLLLNFALFFLGVAATAVGTLCTVPPEGNRAYYTFLILFLVTLIAGIVLLSLWWFYHKSAKQMVREIKSQMPPNPPIREEAATASERNDAAD